MPFILDPLTPAERDARRRVTCECGIEHYAPNHHLEPNVEIDDRYDEYYCTICHTWLGYPCPDPECDYCKDRPAKHSPETEGDDAL